MKVLLPVLTGDVLFFNRSLAADWVLLSCLRSSNYCEGFSGDCRDIWEFYFCVSKGLGSYCGYCGTNPCECVKFMLWNGFIFDGEPKNCGCITAVFAGTPLGTKVTIGPEACAEKACCGEV